MSDMPVPDTPQPDIPAPPQPDIPAPAPEPGLQPPEPSEPPGDDVPKVGWAGICDTLGDTLG